MSKITIDRYDLALLDALQRKGNATNRWLGEQLNMGGLHEVSRQVAAHLRKTTNHKA